MGPWIGHLDDVQHKWIAWDFESCRTLSCNHHNICWSCHSVDLLLFYPDCVGCKVSNLKYSTTVWRSGDAKTINIFQISPCLSWIKNGINPRRQNSLYPLLYDIDDGSYFGNLGICLLPASWTFLHLQPCPGQHSKLESFCREDSFSLSIFDSSCYVLVSNKDWERQSRVWWALSNWTAISNYLDVWTSKNKSDRHGIFHQHYKVGLFPWSFSGNWNNVTSNPWFHSHQGPDFNSHHPSSSSVTDDFYLVQQKPSLLHVSESKSIHSLPAFPKFVNMKKTGINSINSNDLESIQGVQKMSDLMTPHKERKSWIETLITNFFSFGWSMSRDEFQKMLPLFPRFFARVLCKQIPTYFKSACPIYVSSRHLFSHIFCYKISFFCQICFNLDSIVRTINFVSMQFTKIKPYVHYDGRVAIPDTCFPL